MSTLDAPEQHAANIAQARADALNRAQESFSKWPSVGDALDPELTYLRLRNGRLLPIGG